MQTTPQKEHQWLQKLVGEWTFENEAVMGPGQPPVKLPGTDSVCSLGGLWVVCAGAGEMPDGGTAATLMTIGFDPRKNRFVGTFVASMMAHMWIYDGQLDEAGKVLTLNTEGPSMAEEGRLTRYKDVIEFQSDDHRTLTSSLIGETGRWVQFMTASYRRTRA